MSFNRKNLGRVGSGLSDSLAVWSYSSEDSQNDIETSGYFSEANTLKIKDYILVISTAFSSSYRVESLSPVVISQVTGSDITAEVADLVSNVRDFVVVDMLSDNYTMTDAEAIASTKIVTNSGTGKTLTWPTTADARVGASQHISLVFNADDVIMASETGGTTSTLAGGYASDVVVFPGTDVSVLANSYANFARNGSTELLKIHSTALDATPDAGAFEYLTNTGYFSPSALNRGVMPAIHHSINTTAKSLNDNTTSQTYLNTGTLTLIANTTYFFETSIYFGNGTVSHTVDFEIGGTATVAAVSYFSDSSILIASNAGAGRSSWGTSTAATTIMSASTSAGGAAQIKGSITITTAGTLIPKIKFSAAPGGTNEALAGTYFKCYAAGSNTTVTVGNWS